MTDDVDTQDRLVSAQIKRYRKRPVEVEAVQLSWRTWPQVCILLQDAIGIDNPAYYIDESEASDTCGESGPEYIGLTLKTTHGEDAKFRHGDWIIPDSKPGTFYPVKPDIFAQTYELVF